MHEEQLVAAHPLHADAGEAVTVDWPDESVDFETKPHLEISLDRSRLLHDGQAGLSPPRTNISKLLSQLLHLYSYIGIF